MWSFCEQLGKAECGRQLNVSAGEWRGGNVSECGGVSSWRRRECGGQLNVSDDDDDDD